MSNAPPVASDDNNSDEDAGLDAAERADAAENTDAGASAQRDVFARMGRNVRWLLGGRGFAGVASLIYIAIAARSLGPDQFGVFTLVLTYGQLIAGLVQFQSWKGIIRFGSVHLSQRQYDRLARLLGFTATLDWGTAIGGAAVAYLGVHLAAPWLHWGPEQRERAALFSTVLLLATGATPTGIFRLLDRFDLLTLSEGVAPLIRLVGAISAWLGGGGVTAFLIVWAGSSVIQALYAWIAALRLEHGRLALGRSSFAQAVAENHRLWRFMLYTNFSNSLGLFWQHLGLLAVGSYAGPAAAGGFRLADRLASSIAKPIETMTRVLYPEFARLVASDDRGTLRRVFARVTWIAAALALLIVVIAGFGGDLILRLVAGKAYAFAHWYLLLLAIAAAIDLAGFSFEPLHNAHGHAGRVLRSRLIGAAAYLLLLAILLPRLGPTGAAIATIVSSALIFSQLGQSVTNMLSRRSEPAAL